MKLQVVKPEQESIENYTRVDVSPNAIDLSVAADNECSSILANDVLDSFSVENVPSLLAQLVKKVRMGGELIVGGTDIRLFCKFVTNDQIDELSATRLLGSVQSMTTLSNTAGGLIELGLKIVSSQINGVHYEIKASRG
jgi:predicted SAM-dependent methyltransferase